MKKEIKHMNKNVIVPDDIDYGSWRTGTEELFTCAYCRSALFYVIQRWSVVEEDFDYQVMDNRRKSYYVLRTNGIRMYCAECGEWNEDYDKWEHPKDKTVYDLDDGDYFDEDDRMEVKYLLTQYNKTGKYKPMYRCTTANAIKEALDKYEEKNYKVKKNGKKMSAH